MLFEGAYFLCHIFNQIYVAFSVGDVDKIVVAFKMREYFWSIVGRAQVDNDYFRNVGGVLASHIAPDKVSHYGFDAFLLVFDAKHDRRVFALVLKM